MFLLAEKLAEKLAESRIEEILGNALESFFDNN